MSVSDDQSVFLSRCARVGAAATAAGATLRKADGKDPALEITRDGRSIVFPIVTDEVAWRKTSLEEALYAVLVDARGWAGATMDEAALAALDAAEKAQVPHIKSDLSTELGRVTALAEVLGGEDRLQELYTAAGL